MISDELIKQKINETLTKISIHRLNEKIKLFQHVDLPFISIQYRKTLEPVSRKRLRFYLDLIDVWYPVYRSADNKTKAQFISEIFKCECTEEDLIKLKSFKDITKKKVIGMNNENVKTISRIRWRGRDNLNKNIIHFQ